MATPQPQQSQDAPAKPRKRWADIRDTDSERETRQRWADVRDTDSEIEDSKEDPGVVAAVPLWPATSFDSYCGPPIRELAENADTGVNKQFGTLQMAPAPSATVDSQQQQQQQQQQQHQLQQHAGQAAAQWFPATSSWQQPAAAASGAPSAMMMGQLASTPAGAGGVVPHQLQQEGQQPQQQVPVVVPAAPGAGLGMLNIQQEQPRNIPNDGASSQGASRPLRRLNKRRPSLNTLHGMGKRPCGMVGEESDLASFGQRLAGGARTMDLTRVPSPSPSVQELRDEEMLMREVDLTRTPSPLLVRRPFQDAVSATPRTETNTPASVAAAAAAAAAATAASSCSSTAGGRRGAKRQQRPLSRPEEELHHRQQKREGCIIRFKRTQEYQNLAGQDASQQPGEQPAIRPRTPDATDRSLSKRQWEEEVRLWKQDVRSLNGVSEDLNAINDDDLDVDQAAAEPEGVRARKRPLTRATTKLEQRRETQAMTQEDVHQSEPRGDVDAIMQKEEPEAA